MKPRINISSEQARIDRGNKVLAALETETDRGRACVGDAIIDDFLKELFSRRLLDGENVFSELFEVNQPLGAHGARIKLAYILGWIGPKTYHDSQSIHKIRNRMAHNLDIDSFDHEVLRGLVDGFEFLADMNVRLGLRRDKFLWAVNCAIIQLWRLLDESKRPAVGTDSAMVRLDPAAPTLEE